MNRNIKSVSRIIAVMLLCFSCYSVSAQKSEKPYLWPVEGAHLGEGIIYSPQSYINKELNFADLFVRAKLGTNILCPVDGEIKSFGLMYRSSLFEMTGFNVKKSFSFSLDEIKKDKNSIYNTKYNPKYICGSICIKTGKGITIYITGLTGNRTFKTGQKVKRGEILGQSAYAFKEISEPHIGVSISKYSRSSDPMTPFGIKTTFIPPKARKQLKNLTYNQAKEDIDVFISSYKEIYPDYYEQIREEQLDSLRNEVLDNLKKQKKIKLIDFTRKLNRLLAACHDTHIYKIDNNKYNDKLIYQPSIFFGLFKDTLKVTMALDKKFEGRIVKEINGSDKEKLKKIINKSVRGYDAKVESYKDYVLKTTGFIYLDIPPYGNNKYDFNVKFANGETKLIKGYIYKRGKSKSLYANYTKYRYVNYNDGKRYNTKILNDSTAYLALSDFTQTEVELEEIGKFILESEKTKKHLIIDVRNNNGGDIDAITKIYSYIAKDSIKINSYSKIMNQYTYESFKYCLNFKTVEGMYTDYNYVSDKGLILENPVTYAPDSLVHFSGKVYVLTNEQSISAATLLPALIVRSGRGVTVGRETKTAYHYMKAGRFAQIQLPNTKIVTVIPMEKGVFDDVVNERVPYGRGVLPDYPVELTQDELMFTNGDVILNKALNLIKEGKYLVKDYFNKEIKASKDLPIGKLLVGAFILLLVGIELYKNKKKRR